MNLLYNILCLQSEQQLFKGSRSNLRKYTEGNRSVVLFFYNKSCVECENVMVELELVQHKLTQIITILKVPCDEAWTEGLCDDYAIQQYPQVYLLNANQKAIIYNNSYRQKHIVDWILENFDVPFTSAVNVDAINQILKTRQSETVLCLYILTNETRPKIWVYRMAFELLANSVRTVVVKDWKQEDVQKLSKIGSFDVNKTAVFAQSPMNEFHVFDQEVNRLNILAWIRDLLPSVVEKLQQLELDRLKTQAEAEL